MEKSKSLSWDRYELLSDPAMQIFLSVASIWEMVIKENTKKLKFSINLEEGIKASGFTLLPITLPHVLALQELPLHHNDPFDRILLAQTKVEKLTFISGDAKMKNYDITLL